MLVRAPLVASLLLLGVHAAPHPQPARAPREVAGAGPVVGAEPAAWAQLRKPPRDWGRVAAAIDAFALVPNCHVIVGDESGELFAHQKGSVGLDTEMRLYSATKWVSAVAIVALVEDEEVPLSLEDLASAHLPFWTADPSDARSRVTLRHLLGFVSGFSGGGSCAGLALPECVQRTYETASHTGVPGDTFVYNEVHIRLAAGVAVAAAGAPFVELVQRYVFDRVPGGMPATRWGNTENPAAGAGLVSTPRDYSAFLRSYFTHEIVGESWRTEIETDQYPLAERSASDGGWHYGLGNWFVCPEDVSEWDPRCAEEDVHMSGGAAGFRPLTDRRHGYYAQIAFEGIPGIGNGFTLQLYYAIKGLIDEQFAANASIAH